MNLKFLFLFLLLIFVCVGMVRYGTMANTEIVKEEINVLNADPGLQSNGNDLTETYRLPLPGSAPMTNILHTIPLEDVRRGCSAQDCIPSVDAPQFVPASTLTDVLEPDSLGIVIQDVERFYPFPMLETREIVNDFLPDGTPAAVTYCPLCGTGIVFNRELDGEVLEFGVSGMLWQSNLLMYNRAAELNDRNLWSQVLGQAVIGNRAGQNLEVIPSDIITFKAWLTDNPAGQTLTTGTPRDPYGGDYFATAQFFSPDFDAEASALEPMTRVHGIIVNEQPKAYVSEDLFNDMTDFVANERIFVEKSDNQIKFIKSNAETGVAPSQIPDIEGFWFSWVAAHPDTELWIGE